jgi:hypothetical protein
MEKGDILIATNKKEHPHPIVFLEASSEGKFNACILSSKDTKGNIIMSKNHFVEQDENGNDYTIKFKNSHLVPGRIFEKEKLWLNSTAPKGKLTAEGIEFVEKYTKETNPEFHPVPIWEDFPK